jgi:hypothetical protein
LNKEQMNIVEAREEAKRRWGLTAWCKTSRYIKGLKYAGIIDVIPNSQPLESIRVTCGSGYTWEQVFEDADKRFKKELKDRREQQRENKLHPS